MSKPHRDWQHYHFQSIWEIDHEWGLAKMKPVALCEYPIWVGMSFRNMSGEAECEQPAVGRVEWVIPDEDGKTHVSDMMVCAEHAEQVKEQEDRDPDATLWGSA